MYVRAVQSEPCYNYPAMEQEPNTPSDARKAMLEPLRPLESISYELANDVVIQGLRKALDKGTISVEEAADYAEAYEQAKKPQ